MVATIILIGLLLLIIGSAVYHLICMVSAGYFSKEVIHSRIKDKDFTPAVTILKPVRGVDDRAYECWISCCQQDYPDYQIIFGVRDQDDPAIPLIKKLQQEYPQRNIKLVINDARIGISAKVCNLHNIYPEVQSEIIVISDSDIFVPPNYLRAVVAPLADKRTGLVTCLYRATGSKNFSALMEAIGITGEFMLGVLVARKLEGVKFALGSTIVTRKEVLEKFGGFKAIADYLGDDFLLGYLAAQAGYNVEISHCIVETVLPKYRFRDFFSHQLRWARSTKYSRPSGYMGLLFTFTTALSLLTVLIFPTKLAIVIASIAFFIRMLAAWYVGVYIMKDRRLRNYFYLVPIRDLISFIIWLISFVGNTVEWRGDRFRLAAGGKLIPMEKS